MPTPRDVLTPDALAWCRPWPTTGSFAAPPAIWPGAQRVTYRVRQIEDALDVLLFDRSSRQARSPPPATSCSAPASNCCRTSMPWPTA
jgi:hypothetical protein